MNANENKNNPLIKYWPVILQASLLIAYGSQLGSDLRALQNNFADLKAAIYTKADAHADLRVRDVIDAQLDKRITNLEGGRK